MSQFKDFNDLFDPLALPVGGKEYTIPPLSFEAGARVNGVLDGTEELNEEQFLRLVLSDDIFDQLIADGVSAQAINRFGKVALTDFKYTREMAIKMWETAGDPKAMTEWDKQNAPSRALRRSKSTGTARKTR
ncbi:DUF7426 family protein [Humibacter ginsenosidimutans]|uniref:DUF7426 domain-containing protein n=1 Tax=Humibacter ginsenosidimutans TaxID=2599293 RepID=A0A5B8M4Y0_9MICO|nr:hypothetical protein [Humibacter ginsenosidimutans]QDZ15778.1 hypothetical protein FPZ11_14310 [Humibacter ginsenosidimutans]